MNVFEKIDQQMTDAPASVVCKQCKGLMRPNAYSLDRVGRFVCQQAMNYRCECGHSETRRFGPVIDSSTLRA